MYPVVLLLLASSATHAMASHPVYPVVVVPTPPPPPPPPPFTEKTQSIASFEAARASYEYTRCGDARANSNGRSVDAMGTPRHSVQWQNATLAMNNALTVCRDARQALRHQKDFLLGIIQSGTKQDVDAARVRLEPVSSELEALEQFFSSETPRYRELLTVGWGNPHCVETPDGYMPASSICPKK